MIPVLPPPFHATLRGRSVALSRVALAALATQLTLLTLRAETAPAPKPPAAAPAPLPANRRVAAPTLTARESQGLVKLGGNLTERGDFDAAEIAYRQVLDGKAPLETTQAALLGLAHMHRKQGALTKAAAIYERFLKDFPSDDRVPDALLELGRTLRDMGAPRLAISRFYNVINSTLKLPANHGFEHYQLLAKTAQFEVAETHFQNGDYAEANKFYSRLRMLDLAPEDRARAQFKSAYSLQLAGDNEGAANGLRSFIEQWPDDENVPQARYLLASSLRTLNRPQEALTATLDLLRAERSRSSADSKRWAYWQRRTGNQLANGFFQNGDILNALAIYHGLAALSDDPVWRIPVTYQIAQCYERLGDLDRATKTYRVIVDTSVGQTSPEVTETARLAGARLTHVDWRSDTDRQVAALFDSTTGQARDADVKAPFPHDPDRSPSPTPPAL
ncbi:tetratricopeptide repeat protein [Opitutus terrae]|uniref:Tetratrico peptide repeat group 5 domain-containing protein n=1 Tax=Opitutus terrae (strain DSM 11246 / JCM 15787 / PB90-1) TaxID=452637 RepID=B1ZRR2_OPITP|nr:tetratricopeptide repeat protein [Opitutus terrae]ACB73755.1 hypothetical protein Oter_0465 [Opitutus terrae PB90-1]